MVKNVKPIVNITKVTSSDRCRGLIVPLGDSLVPLLNGDNESACRRGSPFLDSRPRNGNLHNDSVNKAKRSDSKRQSLLVHAFCSE